MRSAAPALLALGLALAACSSTSAPAALPAQAEPARRVGSAASASPAALTVPPGEGPQTGSMAALRIGGERHATLGSPQAPVTMVEFSDYGCPYCRLYGASGFHEIKRRFVDSGQVYYVFKDFPVVEQHPQAMLAAQAAECAGEQGRYWDFHDRLFADPREWGAGAEPALDAFARYAGAFGMDDGALRECVAAGRYAEEVGADFAEARALGLVGTPAFIINGKLLSGARTTEQFVQLLEREIGAALE